MKESYLSRESIYQVISEMILELTAKNYRAKPWKLRPEKAALLVLDMQNYFLDPTSHAFTPSAPAIIPNINSLVEMAGQQKMPVIYTRHLNDAENAGRMDKWWRDLVAEGSWESEICKAFGGLFEEEGKRGPSERKEIVKHQYDAFYGTDLEDYLRSKRIEQVIITGVLTNLCCETTARSAFVRGFEVMFPIDATVAYNREFHLGTFRNLGFGFCPILTTSELINSFDERE